MACTYDPTLPTDRDWVRFMLGDTNTDDAQLQDEEIDALVGEEPNRWYAAAEALQVILTRWLSAGRGVVEKQVGKLRIKRGADQSFADAVQGRIDDLRRRGAYELMPSPKTFRVL